MVSTSQIALRIARALAAEATVTHRWRALLLLLIVAVSYLALTPKPPASIDLGWDKLNHMLAFTALASSTYLGYAASRRTRLLRLCALLVFGGVIEVLQLFVPGRSSEWGDLVADSIGIGCGAVIAAYALRAVSAPSMRSR